MKSSQLTQVEQILKQIREYNTQLGYVKSATAIQFLEREQIRVALSPIQHPVLFPAVAGAITNHLLTAKTDAIEVLRDSYNVIYDGE